MKKVLLVLMLIFLTGFNAVFADAGWENPKSIRTYIEPNDKKMMMKQAFAKWTQLTNGKIVFKYVTSPDDAQIKVKFVKDASKDMKNLEQAIGVTHATFAVLPSRKVVLNTATIEIADHAPGSTGKLMLKDRIFRVMVHEIGHAIGFLGTHAHSSDRQSIMFPAAVSRNQDVTQNDLNFLAKLYGW